MVLDGLALWCNASHQPLCRAGPTVVGNFVPACSYFYSLVVFIAYSMCSQPLNSSTGLMVPRKPNGHILAPSRPLFSPCPPLSNHCSVCSALPTVFYNLQPPPYVSTLLKNLLWPGSSSAGRHHGRNRCPASAGGDLGDAAQARHRAPHAPGHGPGALPHAVFFAGCLSAATVAHSLGGACTGATPVCSRRMSFVMVFELFCVRFAVVPGIVSASSHVDDGAAPPCLMPYVQPC